MDIEHLEALTTIAKRWSEAEDQHTRMELLLELRAVTGAQSELDVIALLFQALHIEHERANNKTAEAERWFVAWRDEVKPANWRGDQRQRLKK